MLAHSHMFGLGLDLLAYERKLIFGEAKRTKGKGRKARSSTLKHTQARSARGGVGMGLMLCLSLSSFLGHSIFFSSSAYIRTIVIISYHHRNNNHHHCQLSRKINKKKKPCAVHDPHSLHLKQHSHNHLLHSFTPPIHPPSLQASTYHPPISLYTSP